VFGSSDDGGHGGSHVLRVAWCVVFWIGKWRTTNDAG
jgi:hypothetical protein